MEAVHTGVELDSDLIIAGASNSDALEVLVLGKMRAAITVEHHIRLLLLDHMKEYSIASSSSSSSLSMLLLTWIL